VLEAQNEALEAAAQDGMIEGDGALLIGGVE